jgi:hypothetical protein
MTFALRSGLRLSNKSSESHGEMEFLRDDFVFSTRNLKFIVIYNINNHSNYNLKTKLSRKISGATIVLKFMYDDNAFG